MNAGAVMDRPRHGDRDTCDACGGSIAYIEISVDVGGGEVAVVDAWWSHDEQDVTHEAVPRVG